MWKVFLRLYIVCLIFHFIGIMVTFHLVLKILIAWLCSGVTCWDEVYDEDINLSLNDFVQKLGFGGIESYKRSTADGYILNIFRIKRDGANELMPVIFLHGMTACADTFFVSKNNSGPIVLARNGFDVWFINARGTKNSIGHTKWNADTDREFWMFSWQEIGLIDLPITIDLVLEQNSHEKVILIGHSEGSTSIFVTLSDVPEYNKKVALSIHWGVSVYHEECSTIPLIKSICRWYKILPEIGDSVGLFNLNPSIRVKNLLIDICRYKIFKQTCQEAAKIFTQNDQRIEHIVDWSFVLSKALCGGSIRELLHYTQVGQSGRFARYDYGPEKNLKLYNTSEAPLFHLENVDSAVVLWCGERDIFCTKNDVNKLISQLSNVASTSFKGESYYGHFDFLFAKDINEEMFDDMLRLMRKYST